MAEKKQLGAFWGDDSLYGIESVNTQIKQIFKIDLSGDSLNKIQGDTLIPSEMQASTIIIEELKNKNLESKVVNLSLPTKDIIFRSFVIPWMKSNEVKGVVDFEASKYLPFNLSELSYSYHPMVITEDGVKRIRIIFVAVKKDSLAKFTSIFSQANIDINIIEPAPISLMRVLSYRNLIPKDKTVSVIAKSEDSGKIVIIDQGVPQFVREFQLRIPGADGEESSDDALMTRLINEIRISLDYFNRQDAELQADQIILLSSTETKDLSTNIEEELGVKVTSLTSESILVSAQYTDMGYINSLGATLIDKVDLASNFDLSEKVSKGSNLKGGSSAPSFDIKSLVTCLLICGGLIALSFILPNNILSKPQKKVATLEKKLGSMKGASTDKIKEKTKAINNKIENLKRLRLHSSVSAFLALIPRSLPEGTWIGNVSISYSPSPIIPLVKSNKKAKYQKTPEDSKPKIVLNGYAFNENKTQEFGLVSQFQRNLKSDKDLATIFNNVEIDNTRSERQGDQSVTSFQIVLE